MTNSDKDPKEDPQKKKKSDHPDQDSEGKEGQDPTSDETNEESKEKDDKDKKASEKDTSDAADEQGYGEEYYDGRHHDDSIEDDQDAASGEESEAPKTSSDSGGSKQKDKSKKSYDEKKMPFLDHLEELRWTLIRSFVAIFLAAVVCFIFHKQIVDFLRLPAPDDLQLIYLGPTEGFMVYIKVALFSGLVVALPFVAYEFWKFIVPGLLAKERKLVPPIVFFTVFCFLVGGAFAYLVIVPFAMKFLLGFQTEYLSATLAIGKYLGFVVTLILVFGVVFELPVLSFFLTSVGILTPDFMRSKRRYGIVTIVILAALLTPPDLVTQIMLAVPLIFLYEISIWVSAMVVKKKTEEDEEED